MRFLLNLYLLKVMQAQLDVNNPADYTFAFEIGLKPAIDIDLDNINVTRHKVEITDQWLMKKLSA